jgi:ribosomal-protein-alanine N-acetyltransferase
MTFRIRAARMADLDALVVLENRCFKHDCMSRRSYAAALRNPRALLLVADRSDGHLIGAATLFLRRDSPAARLYSIAVDPGSRGLGLGAKLLALAEKTAVRRGASALRLEASIRNKTALALYRKSGYEIIGRIAAYYENGADALRLEKQFPSSPHRH